MEYVKFDKGDLVVYTGQFPYNLSNGQTVSKEGEEILINSKVSVQKRFFNLKSKADLKINLEDNLEVNTVTDNKVDDKKDLNNMDKDELLKFAEENNIDIDKRKGEEKLREELNNKLNK